MTLPLFGGGFAPFAPPARLDRPGYVPAGFTLGMDGPSGNSAPSVDFLYLHIFEVQARLTITSIFSKVATGGTASAIKMGLWRGGGAGRPTGLPVLADNTGVATTGAGIVSAAISSVTIGPGVYFAGSVSSGAPAATMLVYATSQTRVAMSSTTAAGAMNATTTTAWLVGLRVPLAYASDITTADLTGATFAELGSSTVSIIGLGYA